jgi:hypothetical protein
MIDRTPLFDIYEVAEILKITHDAVLRQIKAKRLVAINVGNGAKHARWRIAQDSLDAFMKDRATRREQSQQPIRTRTRKTAKATAGVEYF